MLYIAHRINTIAELNQLPEGVGVELDLRDSGKRLIVTHDPFSDGEDFETYLQHTQNRFMLLNIKSERIENRALELLKTYQKSHFFFLDSSFPMMVQLSNQGENRLAIRFSEFESIETVVAMKNQVEWVWIDCFSKSPLTPEIVVQLKQTKLKLCLVSPDLLGRPGEIETMAQQIQKLGLSLDAICTKAPRIKEWQHVLDS